MTGRGRIATAQAAADCASISAAHPPKKSRDPNAAKLNHLLQSSTCCITSGLASCTLAPLNMLEPVAEYVVWQTIGRTNNVVVLNAERLPHSTQAFKQHLRPMTRRKHLM